MREVFEQGEGCPVSRRRLLAGAGAAGAVGMLGGTVASALVADGAVAAPAAPPVAQSPQRFGRIFSELPPFVKPSDKVTSALLQLGAPGGLLDAKDDLSAGPVRLITDASLSTVNRDNPTHTAGTTFFGQFIAHDVTFDATSTLGIALDPQSVTNERSPSLDLDTIYGKGPAVNPALYDDADQAKLKVGFGGRFEDLPRAGDGTAIIGDRRNDETLILSGLHAAFLLFHNRVVDQVRAQQPGISVTDAYTRARQTVTWHYQWIILHEYLPQVIGQPLTDRILGGDRKLQPLPAAGQAFIPVEFQAAAYRFGHSMVRPSYRANLAGNADGTAFFGFIFDPSQEGTADPGDLRGGARAARRFIGWQTFFDFGDGAVRRNKRIDTHLSTPLFALPLSAIATGTPPIALPQRTLLRHLTWSLPSGQDVAKALGASVLDSKTFPELKSFGVGFEKSTPLWYYLLKEAEVLADGLTLGPAGGRIVGEVITALMLLDSNAYLNAQPAWTPTLPAATAGTFKMTDLLRFAGVDPASRGQ